MRTTTRIYQKQDLVDALAREEHEEEPDMPLPGLVDLRHKNPLLDKTQVLDATELEKLRSEYDKMRGQVVAPPPPTESTDFTFLDKKPNPMRKVIGGLLAVLIGLVSWSVCRTWMTGHHVARASTPAALPVAPEAAIAPEAPVRPFNAQPAPAALQRTAVDALASGDRESARRAYEQLAKHEREPGPFSVAADILAREQSR